MAIRRRQDVNRLLGFIATGIARLCLLGWAATAVGAAGSPPWHELARGLELARFGGEPGPITILRIDLEHWQAVAVAASAGDGQRRTVRQWAEKHGLTAAINAGMYAADLSTHTGFFQVDDHVNNPLWNQRDYRQAACFEPRRLDLPRFVLHDLDVTPEDSLAARYRIVLQNLRLIKKPGENRWTPGERQWAEACLGEDRQGRMLWIYSPTPHAMHTWNERLLALPIGLVAAQHLEGGPEAKLWLADEALGDLPLALAEISADITGPGGWPVPNVLGIRPRPSTPPPTP